MPVRSVTNRYGGSHIIGQFPSLKVGSMVRFESRLEMDCLYLLDYDPLVVSFETQPLAIAYRDDKRARQYIPDVLVRFHNAAAPLLLECKPADQIETPENQRKFAAARTWCAGNALRFAVVTERMIREGVYLQNVKRLAQFARHPVDAAFAEACSALLCQSPQQTLCLSELAASMSPEYPAHALSRIYRLLYHRHLAADLDRALLDDHTPVTLPFQVQGDPHAQQNLHCFRALLLA